MCLGVVCSDSVRCDYLFLYAVNELGALGDIYQQQSWVYQAAVMGLSSSHGFHSDSSTYDHTCLSFKGVSLSLV